MYGESVLLGQVLNLFQFAKREIAGDSGLWAHLSSQKKGKGERNPMLVDRRLQKSQQDERSSFLTEVSSRGGMGRRGG